MYLQQEAPILTVIDCTCISPMAIGVSLQLLWEDVDRWYEGNVINNDDD